MVARRTARLSLFPSIGSANLVVLVLNVNSEAGVCVESITFIRCNIVDLFLFKSVRRSTCRYTMITLRIT